MYKAFFGLNQKPFLLKPEPSMAYGSEMHNEAFAMLRYGIEEQKDFVLLTGDIGTGKTTLLQALTSIVGDKVHTCHINNPNLTNKEFYTILSKKFGFGDYTDNKGTFILEFEDLLSECHKNDERIILIIDEAQILPTPLLEEIRLLSNQNAQNHGILSIFLVGQPEFNVRLNEEQLAPLRQRISTRAHLSPFSSDDTKKYIQYRLRKAGAKDDKIFSDEAITLIHQEAKGIPRLINIICDKAMLQAFADDQKVIDQEIIKNCVQELQPSSGQTPQPAALPTPAPEDSAKTGPQKRKIPRAVVIGLIVCAGLIVIILAVSQFVPEGQAWLRDKAAWLMNQFDKLK